VNSFYKNFLYQGWYGVEIYNCIIRGFLFGTEIYYGKSGDGYGEGAAYIWIEDTLHPDRNPQHDIAAVGPILAVSRAEYTYMLLERGE